MKDTRKYSRTQRGKHSLSVRAKNHADIPANFFSQYRQSVTHDICKQHASTVALKERDTHPLSTHRIMPTSQTRNQTIRHKSSVTHINLKENPQKRMQREANSRPVGAKIHDHIPAKKWDKQTQTVRQNEHAICTDEPNSRKKETHSQPIRPKVHAHAHIPAEKDNQAQTVSHTQDIRKRHMQAQPHTKRNTLTPCRYQGTRPHSSQEKKQSDTDSQSHTKHKDYMQAQSHEQRHTHQLSKPR